MINELRKNRRDSADDAFEEYDFSPYVVVEDDGWEYTDPGRFMARNVYLIPDDGYDGDSLLCRFTVEFETIDNATVLSSVAVMDGQRIGRVPSRSKLNP